jgi:hypothetical protein
MNQIIDMIVQCGGVLDTQAAPIVSDTVLSKIPGLKINKLTSYIDYVFFADHVGMYPENLTTTLTVGELINFIMGSSIGGSVLKNNN